jgi:hypothetical protein
MQYADLEKLAAIAVSHLPERYGFVCSGVEEYRFRLANEFAELIFHWDPQDGVHNVDILDPRSPKSKPYSLVVVDLVRNSLQPQMARPEHMPSFGTERFSAEVEWLCGELNLLCSDMLQGDFSRIQAEGYAELDDFIDSRIPIVLQLPNDDPIKLKFWSSDWSWIADLRDRERKPEPASQRRSVWSSLLNWLKKR